MSFREKSAWISFVLLLVVFGSYFGRLAWVLATGRGGRGLFHFFLALVVALVILEIVLHIVAAKGSPHDARLPKDERERLITMRATQVAFPVLVAGGLASIALIHLYVSAWLIAHAMLGAIAVAELVKFGTEIVLYRRSR